MNSPPRQVPTGGHTATTITRVFSQALQNGLDAALLAQERATPEFDFADASEAQSYHYFAEVERNHFKPHEAKKLRQLITDAVYWKNEVQCYAAAVEDFQKNASKMGDWRSLAGGYQALLGLTGLSQHEVEKLRLSIENSGYWETEANLFKMQSALRENKLAERWKNQRERRQKGLAGQSSEARQPSTKKSTQNLDSVSSRTRSKTGSGRVTKRGSQNKHRIMSIPAAVQHIAAYHPDGSSQFEKAFKMSTPVPIDLTDIVLLLADFTGVDDILKLSNNSAYSFTPPSNAEDPGAAWLGQLSAVPKGPILCLKFGQGMFSAEGWVFGSAPDTDAADIQLSVDNSTGVSKRHFRNDVNPISYHPRLTVLKRSLQLIVQGRTLSAMTANATTEIRAPSICNAHGSTFLAWQPNLTNTQYRKSGPETISSNVRYGPNGRVYVFQGYSGKGASASVMLVQERASKAIFAAKEPYYKISDDAGVRKNRWEELKQEHEYLLPLDHPHIVKVHDIVPAQDDREPAWLIEDYIPDCLCTQELDEQSAIVVFTHLLSALAYIHSLDIVHRDVKPSNILMKDDNAILWDFGAARHRVQGKFDTFTGTSIYRAPEFLEESRSYSNKVDMFSCGMILLECFSAWDPRADSEWSGNALNSHAHAKWMREIPLAHIKEVPIHMRPLLRGLLRRYPEKRWSALHSLAWLSNHIQGGGDEDSFLLRFMESPEVQREIDQETIHPDNVDIATPQQRHNKRPASASLSPKVLSRGILHAPRQLRFGEDLPSSTTRWPPSQSPLGGPLSELASTLAWGAPFVSPPPIQSEVFGGPLVAP
ncbi:Calcium/calmodulin-dependent protein kinase type IV, partial [Metarhizium majus ARSEF 297]